MMDINPALTKVETPLMERYVTVCDVCKWDRQFFGTLAESRESAIRMGWEFTRILPLLPAGAPAREVARCPHCKLLIKETPHHDDH